jgi:hypothetical protein
MEYLKDRNDWDDETYESVSWPPFSVNFLVCIRLQR